MSFIDAHCHLADPRFKDLDGVIERSKKAKIIGWIQGGIEPGDWTRQAALKARFGPTLFTSFGLHPWWVAKASRSDIETGFRHLESRLPEADAAGEMGIDLGPKYAATLEMQKEVFVRQLEIAERLGKPIILHVVRAHAQVLGILQGRPPQKGMIHSFLGSSHEAQGYITHGLLISISGNILRKGYEKAKKTVSALPSDRLVLETDSPDQGPLGEVNEPAFLLKVAEAAAKLRNTDAETILKQSTENLKTIFA